MSFVNEFLKASRVTGSFADLLRTGNEDKALEPSPVQPAFARDSDTKVQPLKSENSAKSFVVEYWEKIPQNMRPFVGIGGAIGGLFLFKKFLS